MPRAPREAGRDTTTVHALARRWMRAPHQTVGAARRSCAHGAGVLDPSEVEQIDEDDPYARDPKVHPALHMHSDKPLQAETPAALLLDSWVTPSDLWFVRGHHPVPEIDEKEYRLTVRGRGLAEPREFKFTLEELKANFPKHEVVATLQCGGNGRRLFNDVKKTMGIPWGAGAMSTARWGGARLSDVLRFCGLHDTERAGVEHVQFEGAESLTASIPADKAVSSTGDVLLAYEMNGEAVRSRPTTRARARDRTPRAGRARRAAPSAAAVVAGAAGGCARAPLTPSRTRACLLTRAPTRPPAGLCSRQVPRAHGYPVRAVVPGYVGVRNVKWLTAVVTSDEEAKGPWQRGIAYKGFSPNVDSFDHVDVEAVPSVQEQPVMSAIVLPQPGETVEGDSVEVRGLAWSGGGRGIVRVDVSNDDGQTWTTAELKEGSEQKLSRAWAWTFWTATLPVPPGAKPGDKMRLCAKATDASYNTQPERSDAIWNIRGILYNAWSRVEVELDP